METPIELEWTWDDLPAEQYFFVELTFTGNETNRCKRDWQYFKWTKETHLMIEPWLYDIICPLATGQAGGLQLTPLVDSRRFEWQFAPSDGMSGGIVIPN
jgi:hypothetical protein